MLHLFYDKSLLNLWITSNLLVHLPSDWDFFVSRGCITTLQFRNKLLNARPQSCTGVTLHSSNYCYCPRIRLDAARSYIELPRRSTNLSREKDRSWAENKTVTRPPQAQSILTHKERGCSYYLQEICSSQKVRSSGITNGNKIQFFGNRCFLNYWLLLRLARFFVGRWKPHIGIIGTADDLDLFSVTCKTCIPPF